MILVSIWHKTLLVVDLESHVKWTTGTWKNKIITVVMELLKMHKKQSKSIHKNGGTLLTCVLGHKKAKIVLKDAIFYKMNALVRLHFQM